MVIHRAPPEDRLIAPSEEKRRSIREASNADLHYRSAEGARETTVLARQELERRRDEAEERRHRQMRALIIVSIVVSALGVVLIAVTLARG